MNPVLPNRKIRVIFDTAMTFGLPGGSIDEGLALMYLLAQEQVDIVAITMQEIDNTIDGFDSQAREDAAAWLLRLMGRTDIPVCSGKNAAAFIVNEVRNNPNEITLITTGRLTNVSAATAMDNTFRTLLDRLIVFGGQYFPLQRALWENQSDLTLSVDPSAAEQILMDPANLTLIPMQTAELFKLNLEDLMQIRQYSNKLYYLVKEHLLSPAVMAESGKPEAFLWSAASALYAVHPEYFSTRTTVLDWEASDMETGTISVLDAQNGADGLHIPEYLFDIDAAVNELHAAWAQSPLRNRGVGQC